MHYVGYVEEDETPEMIMAKFAELEEIQRKASDTKRTEEDGRVDVKLATGGGDGSGDVAAVGLTDEQLLQVFKQTSMFNVKTAMQDNAMLTGIDDFLVELDERYGSDDDFDSDDEDIAYEHDL